MKEKKKLKYDLAYLRIASEWGKLSYCKRKQVGAIIVRDKMIISDGYNGTPSGFENCCKECSKLIHQSGIKRVVYLDEYKDTSGVDFLRKAGVEAEHLQGIDE